MPRWAAVNTLNREGIAFDLKLRISLVQGFARKASCSNHLATAASGVTGVHTNQFRRVTHVLSKASTCFVLQPLI